MYDDKTEILTSIGFINFSELTPRHQVAQYHEDGTISFTVPSQRQCRFLTGDMVRFTTSLLSTSKIDLLVTPNHRMVYNHEGVNVSEASTHFDENRWIIQAGKSRHGKSELSLVEKLKIAFQADSSYAFRANNSVNGNARISLMLKKTSRKLRLEAILNQLKIKFSRKEENAKSKKRKTTTVFVKPQEVYAHYWISLPIDVASTFSKNFVQWVNLAEVNWKWCRAFVEEAAFWDGKDKDSSVIYTTTIESNADIVQSAAVLGMMKSIKIMYDKKIDKRRIQTGFSVICDTNVVDDGKQIKKSIEHYQGNIYCVTVPTGMICVRRNGIVTISGSVIENIDKLLIAGL